MEEPSNPASCPSRSKIIVLLFFGWLSGRDKMCSDLIFEKMIRREEFRGAYGLRRSPVALECIG
jgi:hypothetical protein